MRLYKGIPAYNSELEIIDSQNKAYLLGLFYSDGNVSKDGLSALCRISLKKSDEALLLYLKEVFPFFRISYATREPLSTILFSSFKKFRLDLITHGCFPAKSKGDTDILQYPQINSLLNRHFIRGYFDGNGGCTLTYSPNSKRSKNQKRVYIYSTNKEFILQVQKVLETSEIYSTISITEDKRQGDYQIMYKLTIRATSYVKFYKYIYEDSLIFLERKKSLFGKILELPIVGDYIKPSCIYCDSTDTRKYGYSKYKLKNGTVVKKAQFQCTNCWKIFRIAAPWDSDISRVDFQPIFNNV